MKPLAVIALLLLTGCSVRSIESVVPPLHAQNIDACPPGTAVEHNQYVALLTKACQMVGYTFANGPFPVYPGGQEIEPKDVPGESKVEITLTMPLHLQAVRMWQGTGDGTKLEAGESLEIDMPDGKHFTLFRELDKHADVIGDYDDWRQLHLELPIGTHLTLRRESYWCTTSPNCATQEMVQLYGSTGR